MVLKTGYIQTDRKTKAFSTVRQILSFQFREQRDHLNYLSLIVRGRSTRSEINIPSFHAGYIREKDSIWVCFI